MSGIALYGATEHNTRKFPGVYLGNVCGVRTTQEAGGGGFVVSPAYVPGAVFEDTFVSPLSGVLAGQVHLRAPFSGTTAVLTVLVDDIPAGELDLLALAPDTPAPLPLVGTALTQGQSVIKVRVACSPDVRAAAGLELTLSSAGASGAPDMPGFPGFPGP